MSEKNSQTLPLFIEDVYEALRAAVQAAGGAKVVAAALWPTKPIEQARRDLLDCLNRDNSRKFDAEEIIAVLFMAREAGFHQAKHWLDNAIGYQPTPVLDPVVQRDRLAEAFDRAAQNFAALQVEARALLKRK